MPRVDGSFAPVKGGENWLFSTYPARRRGDPVLVQDGAQYGTERGFRTTIAFNLPQVTDPDAS
jgi:hypothetical protein